MAALLMAAGACHKEDPSSTAGGTATGPAAAASSAPVDHLAPDELVEGDQKGFGVVLPRDVHVDGAFADLLLASSKIAVHPLAKYFRARLTEGSLREGDEAATFEHVHVPGNTVAEYGLRIYLVRGFTRIEMRDTTPPPPLDVPPAMRWKQAGLTPDGRLLDPTHLE